jgi:hypothetical protein
MQVSLGFVVACRVFVLLSFVCIELFSNRGLVAAAVNRV